MEKKSKIKMIVLIILGVLLALGLTIGTRLIIKNQANKFKNRINNKWGNIYYEYLKDVKELGGSNAGIPDDMKKGTLAFYDVDGLDYPIMNIKYESNNKEYSNIYYIDKDRNKVDVIVYEDKTDIEMLYNKSNKTYEYYTHTTKNDINIYKSLKDQINKKLGKTDKVEEYKFDETDKKSVQEKFNEVFKKIENKVKEYDYDINYDLNDIKKIVSKYSKEIKKFTKNLASKIKEMIENNEFDVDDIEEAVGKIESKKEDIEKVIDDKADEIINSITDNTKSSNDSISVGGYNIKYGTYVGEAASEGINLVIYNDGSCTYNNISCTYKVGNYDFAQDESTKGSYKDCLIVNADYTYYFYPYSNSTIGDGGINSYTYNG